MKIALITDGNSTLGLGHVYQSVTLAKFLLEENNEIVFFTKSEQAVCNLIEKSGFKVVTCATDESIYESVKEQNPDRILFDKLDVSPELAHNFKSNLKKKLIIFTNLTEANSSADMTVMAGMGSDFQNIVKRHPSGKIEYFGPKYWILRPEFYELKKKNKALATDVHKIMLMFGGADPMNMSSHVLDQLLMMDEVFEILLVLGGSFQHQEYLDKVMDKHTTKRNLVRIVQGLRNVGDEMYNHDVVFCSPGLSMYEALIVGTPVVGFHQNKMQQEVHKEQLKTFGIEDMDKVSKIINNKEFIFPGDENIRSMEIGLGKDELIKEILN